MEKEKNNIQRWWRCWLCCKMPLSE